MFTQVYSVQQIMNAKSRCDAFSSSHNFVQISKSLAQKPFGKEMLLVSCAQKTCTSQKMRALTEIFPSITGKVIFQTAPHGLCS